MRKSPNWGVTDRAEQSFKDEIKALDDRLYGSWQVKNVFRDPYHFKMRIVLEKLLEGKDTSSAWSPFSANDAWNGVGAQAGVAPAHMERLKVAFDAAFNRKLPEVMNQRFSMPDPEALQLGREFGWEIQWRKAGHDGFRQAFEQVLIQRSEQAYANEFAPAYSERFSRNMEEIQNRAALQLSGSLKLSFDGQNILDFHGTVMNYGGVAARPDVLRISGSNLQTLRPLSTPNVGGHTEIDLSQPGAIRFNGDLVPGVEYAFTMTLHDHSAKGSFSVSFADSLDAYERAQTQQDKDMLRRAIIKSISNEWDDARGIFKSNIYANDLNSPEVSRLGMLVRHAKQHPQSQVYTFAPELKSMSRSMWYIYIFKNRSYNLLVDELAAAHK